MKKILAFVLASIMVLSLVPASAFAAMGRGCELPHTLDNCENTLVETVPAKCNQVGYQVYECNACGEQFLANFVEKTAHTWKDNSNNSDRKNQTLSCKDKKDGIKYVKCTVCSVAEKQVTPWNQGHTPVYVSGFGCEALYKCSVCKVEFYGLDKNNEPKPEASHNWEFTSVEKEPEIVNGSLVPGAALYTCKDCKDTKTVEIFAPDCRCYGNEDVYCTKIVTYKAATCDATGTLAVYKCDDCNQLYSANKDGKDFQPIDKVEDAIIDALGHTPKKNTSSTKGCTTTYTCDRCSKAVVEYAHDKGDDYVVVTEYSVVDCVNYGYSVYLCNYCGWSDAIFTEPTGHKTETVVVDSTCANFGYIYTYCTNENCSVTVNKNPNGASIPNTPVYEYVQNGIVYKVAVADKDGVLQPVKVVSLVRNNALNPNAHDYELVASQDVACDVAGLDVYKCKYCNKMYYETIPATQHEFDEDKTEYVAASCSTPGYIRKYCVKCDQYVTVATIPFTPGVHNYEVVEKHHNCTAPSTGAYYDKNGKLYHGYDVYKCTGCTATLTVWNDLVPTAPQTWFANKAEAELYHFGAAYLQPDGTWAYTYTADLELQEELCVASTCYSNGYDVYKCTKCEKLVYVTAEKLPHTNFKTTAAKAATCSKTGNIEYNTCYVCSTLFIWVDAEGNQVVKADLTGTEAQLDITNADIIVNKHASTLTPKTVKDCTNKVIHTYWQCTGKDCGKKFADATASTTYSGPTKPITHQWSVVVPYVAATCNKAGTVGIDYCAACDKYQITENYITIGINSDFTPDYAQTKLVKRVSDALTLEEAEAYELKCYNNINTPSIEIYVAANKTVSANTIVIPKAEHAWHAETETYFGIVTETVTRKDCSKPAYDHNYCVLCGYEFLDNYKPASSKDGHVNKYGQLLKGECGYLATIKDLECFYCGETVVVEHNKLGKDIHVDATCTTDGYTYNYCVDCGKKFIVDVVFADADAYHADEDNYVLVGVPADYANKGDYYYACDCCGKQLTKTVKADAKKTGIELVLTADAANYAVGSTIYVTVSLDSFYGAKAWGLEFLVKYNPLVLEFIDEDTTWVTETFTEAHDAAAQTDPVYHPATKDELEHWTYEPNGTVKVVANAKSDVTVKGSQDLVVLAFKVIANVSETEVQIPVYTVEENRVGQQVLVSCAPSVVTEAGKAVNVFYNEFKADLSGMKFVEPDYIVEPNEEDYEDALAYGEAMSEYYQQLNDAYNAYIAEQNELQVAKTGETLAIELVTLLDVDGDGKGGNDVTLLDIRALYELIVFDEYMVEADTNFDGIVNFTDLENAYRVSTGRLSVEELAGLLPADFFPGMGAKN